MAAQEVPLAEVTHVVVMLAAKVVRGASRVFFGLERGVSLSLFFA
ncbi:hypothetical protein J2T13_003517 [Paenibacillus sp. DS2015]